MAKKFIPNGDLDFLTMARAFATTVVKEPTRFGVSDNDAQTLDATVRAFGEAMNEHGNRYCRSPASTAKKEEARRAAETIIRRLAAGMRVNPSIDAAGRVLVGIDKRPKAPAPTAVPNEVPRLFFKRALHESGFVPEHELEFCALDYSPKPPGAVRLELFVDLIPADVDVIKHYDAGVKTRPIYVRSFVKSPITLVPPMADVPIRVVYFARWADVDGEVGPMAGPVAGWVEGGKHHLMSAMALGHKPVMRVELSPEIAARETTVMIALLSGQAAKQLSAPPVMRQLEAPVESDAA